jgi:hypothetical protein
LFDAGPVAAIQKLLGGFDCASGTNAPTFQHQFDLDFPSEGALLDCSEAKGVLARRFI